MNIAGEWSAPILIGSSIDIKNVHFSLLLQPNFHVYHCWGSCWNFGIHKPQRIHLLCSCYGLDVSWSCGQDWIFYTFILRFLEPDSVRWFLRRAYGKFFVILTILIHPFYHIQYQFPSLTFTFFPLFCSHSCCSGRILNKRFQYCC